ncbi:NF038130 family PEP-CTERM protein [Nostoc sp. CHAB 5834]|nr:NF038130 family PEP-CTERM protein [Nostoc sp. CHAB 5834]
MTFQKLLIGALVAVGVSVTTVPAQAGTLTLTGATIGGTAASDYLVYDSNATNTFTVANTSENVQKVLSGDIASPTGNVELAASSEQAGFDFTKNTTLTGTIGGKTLTLSSLTSDDWFGVGQTTTTYGSNNLANNWFNQVLSSNNITTGLLTKFNSTQESLFKSFLGNGGFQRFSDPNISYVNQDDTSGLITIGLAGHLNATPLITPLLGLPSNLSKLLPPSLQASEIVKYTYDGKTDYLYPTFRTLTVTSSLVLN